MRSASTWAACSWCPTTARSPARSTARRGARPQPLLASATTRRWPRWTGPRPTPRTSPTTSAGFLAAVGVPEADRQRAHDALVDVLRTPVWCQPVPGSRQAVQALAARGSAPGGHVEQRRHRRGPPRPPRVGAGGGRARRARGGRHRLRAGRRRQARRARVPGDHRRASGSPPPGSCTSATARSTTSPAPPPSACRPCTWIRSTLCDGDHPHIRVAGRRAARAWRKCLGSARPMPGRVDAHVHLMRSRRPSRPRIYAPAC